MAAAALTAALTAAAAFVRVPFWPSYITMQTLAVLLGGLALGPLWGAAAQGLYVLLGLVGLPVFASGVAGFAAVFTPTFGFLLSFPIAAAVCGAIARGRKSAKRRALAVCAGTLVIYAVGLPYLAFAARVWLGSDVPALTLLAGNFFAYLPGDALKCACAVALARLCEKALQK
jgi:biotin transport system substrate-specific component